MAELRRFPVYAAHGKVGEILASARFLDDRPEKTLRLLSGREVQIPSDSLQVREDGSFFLPKPELIQHEMNGAVSSPESNTLSPLDPPAISHQLDDASHNPPRNTSLDQKAADLTRLESFAAPAEALFENGYSVETVRIDRIVDGPVAERHEGDILVLPIVEEVWVVEKKLLLREEIRITPRKKQVEKIRTIEKQ